MGLGEGRGVLGWAGKGLTPSHTGSMTSAWVSPQPHSFSSQVAKKGCRHLVCSSGDPQGGSSGLHWGEEELAGAVVNVQVSTPSR